ncbi:iron-containing alcohol dehydrogenase [Rhodobacterales bacterium HKCCE4037]|nr:iron-containing alcohol dehydrogenase [Rhodobacterales bacterium HKCCE4037]
MRVFNMGGQPPVTFGAGRLRKVPELVAAMGGGPVLIVADAMLAELGVTERLTKGLAKAGIAHVLAADVAGEPKQALIDALCVKARESDAKLIIGMGGGAAMDAAKLVAAIAKCGEAAEVFDLAAKPLPADRLPSIAIPTTAGTGSEVTRTSVVSRADGSKGWFWGEELLFTQAVLDPELTLSLPPHLTAWTGIDAVAHALEGSTARTTSPAGLLFGLEALRILREYLPKAVADGSDVEVRGKVLWGSMVAGLALHNCNTHMGHNISHAIGSLARVHHGLATGLGLEVAMPWLVERPEGAENYALAAEALGGAREASALPGALSALMRECGIAAELPAECAGVEVAALAAAMKDPANFGMSQNAACKPSVEGLDEIAGMVMRLPVAAKVA